MKRFAELADLLVSTDPRQALDKTLGFVLSSCGCGVGAVLTVKGDRLSVLASRELDLETLPELRAAWTAGRDVLEKGRHTARDGAILVPLRDASGVLALLYLERPKRFESEELSFGLVALAKAVLATLKETGASSATSDIEAYLSSTRSEDVQRKALVLALNRNEWNVARVARILGITRRTVYLRLQRYGIEREHPPKS